jgi:hypothetical protein
VALAMSFEQARLVSGWCSSAAASRVFCFIPFEYQQIVGQPVCTTRTNRK